MLAESIMRSSSMPMPVRKAASTYVFADIMLDMAFWGMSLITAGIALIYGSAVMGFVEGLFCFGFYSLGLGIIWFAINVLSLIGLPRVFVKGFGCFIVFLLMTSVFSTVKSVDAWHHAPGSVYFKTEQQKIDDYDNWCRSQGMHVYTIEEMRGGPIKK